MRFLRIFMVLLFWSWSLYASLPDGIRGEWRVVALDSTHLALTGDYFEAMEEKVHQQLRNNTLGMGEVLSDMRDLSAVLDVAATEVIGKYRPEIVRLLLLSNKYELTKAGDVPAIGIKKVGNWLSAAGQAFFKNSLGHNIVTSNALAVHHVFLTLTRPLAEGEALSIRLPTDETVRLRYSASTPTPLFKLNQVGYALSARLKYAYLGGWQGTAGAFPMAPYIGKDFELCRVDNGEVVCRGKVNPRIDDPVDKNNISFTGEEVAELDFSKATTPGVFFLRVEGLGRSENFTIGADGISEAFYVHAKGLYHKRCGIAKTEPYTHWGCPECHRMVHRGGFPPDVECYGDNKSKDEKCGFYDIESKRRLNVNHFKLIEYNSDDWTEELHLPGGWHDAADCDRRQFHLGIVCDLAAVYMLKPQNFTDGQLNIPESGNGVPDILDEACWGLKHLIASQQEDGGVSGWVESNRHPDSFDGLPSEEKIPYYLSCATRKSSIMYAATASELALALLKAGKVHKSETYRESAKKAWEYAINLENDKPRTYKYKDNAHKDMTLVYYEPSTLPQEYLMKAAFNLSILYNDPSYELKVDSAELQKAMINAWSWSPFIWIEREVFGDKRLDEWRDKMRKEIIKKANHLLKCQEDAYPYRIPWLGPKEKLVHTMGFGNFHPLRQARFFIAAHAITSEPEYLDAAYLANDFHNGANPWGMTMTSGLGRVYPVRFLDLTSYGDGIDEFVPGITPYRNNYYIGRRDCEVLFGLFYPPRKKLLFDGLHQSLFPKAGLRTPQELRKELEPLWPIWRRLSNMEFLSIASSEYTVWETIAPPVMVTGYLLENAMPPKAEWRERRPEANLRKLPGYAPLP